jgi:alkylation response protein AidB-like acyl-CoA dehydrogenase
MRLDQLLERAREVTREVIAPNSPRTDEGHWPEEGIRALQKAGLGGLVVPLEYGGAGQSLLGLARVCEAIGFECASTSLCFGMHCVGAAVIAAKAGEHQQSVLEAIARGEHLTTLALSEPGTGSHFYFPETRLSALSNGKLKIEGTKSFVTNGGHADSYVVSTVAADPEAPPNLFSCVVMQGDTDGIVWGPPWEGLGMRGNSSRSVELKGVIIPEYDLLGQAGDQIWYVFNVIAPYFLMAMSGTYLGLASRAVHMAKDHLCKRKYAHSGSTLSQLSVLQHRLGRIWGEVERTRQMVYYAAEEADRGGPYALPAICYAKANVAHNVVKTVDEAMALCGGIAYRNHSMFDRILRDAHAAHIMAPTTDVLLTWTGRALLDEPILGD